MKDYEKYNNVSFECSKIITKAYSTSFTLGIKILCKDYHKAIYGIYAFVRYADEIVDTFHTYNKKKLLETFKASTYEAIQQKISLNPVLHAFQEVVNQYAIDIALIDAFFKSMEMDLNKTTYNEKEYKKYVYGSAEVVGLMCIKIFCNDDQKKYDKLVLPAKHLGAALQKVNFLRDMKSDFKERKRVYFPQINFKKFTIKDKKKIEHEIALDFEKAFLGIDQLPKKAKWVYILCMYITKDYLKK